MRELEGRFRIQECRSGIYGRVKKILAFELPKGRGKC